MMLAVYCVLSLPPPRRLFVGLILNRRTEHWNLGLAYLQELAAHTVAEARRYYDFNLTVKLQHVDHQHVVVNQGLLF